MSDVHVNEVGSGTPVVLLHGSLSDGLEAWAAQQPLAAQGYRLVLPDRRGYGRTQMGVPEDYERDAADLAPLLGEGAHLVGHSYGALSALWTAAARPEAVLSLTLIEPPAFGLAADHPDVAAYRELFQALWARTELSDREFLREFMLLMDMQPEWSPTSCSTAANP